MRFARATSAGISAGGVSVLVGALLTLPLMAVHGSAQAMRMFVDQPVGQVILSLLPAFLIGACLGLVVLVPYSLYRDRRPASLIADLVACQVAPAVMVVWGLTVNLRSQAKRHVDLLFTIESIALMAVGGLAGLWLLRAIMGRPLSEQLTKIFEA